VGAREIQDALTNRSQDLQIMLLWCTVLFMC